MKNLLCFPCVSSLLIKKTNKKKQQGCLSGVQDDKRCENRYNVLCKDKKKSRIEAGKAVIKMFLRDLTHKTGPPLSPARVRGYGTERPSQRRAKSKQCMPDPLLLLQQSHWHSAPLSNSAYLTQPFVSGSRNH